jgi:hypothetical protein
VPIAGAQRDLIGQCWPLRNQSPHSSSQAPVWLDRDCLTDPLCEALALGLQDANKVLATTRTVHHLTPHDTPPTAPTRQIRSHHGRVF